MFICYYRYIYAYFIDILRGSVKTHLQCGGMYNNHIIANCLQSVRVKEFWKSVNNWQRYGQKQSATFFIGPPCRRLEQICLFRMKPVNPHSGCAMMTIP